MIARVVAAAGLVWAIAGPVGAAPAGATLLFHLGDGRIGEASGIAVGLISPGVVYVHNDSGDRARFFAVDRRTGATRATYTVPGARNVDWEDIAVAPDARGVPSVWLADIGDNSASRTEIAVYRVDEPHVDGSALDVAASTAVPDTWRLRYPGAAADAEALAVSPRGSAYVFTKSLDGTAHAFALPEHADASRVQSLRAIGSVRIGFTGTAGGPNPFGQRTVTGAALSRDGATLALRTYTDAYIWPVRGGDVTAAIRTKPVRLALPAQPLGEGIALERAGLLIDSEGKGSAVFGLDLPPLAAATTSSTATTAARPSPADPLSPQRAPTPTDKHDGHLVWAGVGAALLIIAMLYAMARLSAPQWRQGRRDRRRDRQARRPR